MARSRSMCLHEDVSGRCGGSIHLKTVTGLAFRPGSDHRRFRFGGVFGRLNGDQCAAHRNVSTRDGGRQDVRCCCSDQAACGKRFAKGRAFSGNGLS